MKYASAITDFIFANEGVTQEYPLLKHLEKEVPQFFAELGASPSLYQKHFLLFYRLYQLAESLKDKKLTLQISPLEIRIFSKVTVESSALSETDALQEFYSNYDNLFLSDEEVASMQKRFWEKYLALDQKAEALAILELDLNQEVTLAVVKKQYKRLAKQHHPDKGGDALHFKKLRAAFEQLKILLS